MLVSCNYELRYINNNQNTAIPVVLSQLLFIIVMIALVTNLVHVKNISCVTK